MVVLTAGAIQVWLKAATLPVIGVSIGRTDDKGTWRIDYAPEATPEQRAAGAALVAAFDPADPAVSALVLHEGVIAAYQIDKNLQATALWMLQRLLGRPPTGPEKQTAKTEWIAIRKGLG